MTKLPPRTDASVRHDHLWQGRICSPECGPVARSEGSATARITRIRMYQYQAIAFCLFNSAWQCFVLKRLWHRVHKGSKKHFMNQSAPQYPLGSQRICRLTAEQRQIDGNQVIEKEDVRRDANADDDPGANFALFAWLHLFLPPSRSLWF